MQHLFACFRLITASLFMFAICAENAGATALNDLIDSKVNSLVEKPIDDAMASALKVDLPINLQDNNVLPTVDNAVLPGGPFQASPLKPTLDDLAKPLAPGDYTVPMMAFCMQYNSSGRRRYGL